MHDSRLSKKIFYFDLRSNVSRTWGGDLRNMLADLGKAESVRNYQKINLGAIKISLEENDQEKWKRDILSKPKLRTYRTFKNHREAEPYLFSSLTRSRRSLIAQIRFGILPLAIETGRFSGQKLEERLCKYCNSDCTETESHFIFDCELYNELRCIWFDKIRLESENFHNLSVDDKYKLLFSKPFVKLTAENIEKFWYLRRAETYVPVTL